MSKLWAQFIFQKYRFCPSSFAVGQKFQSCQQCRTDILYSEISNDFITTIILRLSGWLQFINVIFISIGDMVFEFLVLTCKSLLFSPDLVYSALYWVKTPRGTWRHTQRANTVLSKQDRVRRGGTCKLKQETQIPCHL